VKIRTNVAAKPLAAAVMAISLTFGLWSHALAQSPPLAYNAMLAKLQSLNSYQVTITEATLMQTSDTGAKPRVIKSTDHVKFKAPNYFNFQSDGLLGGTTIVSDGKTEFFYSNLAQQYAAEPAPKNIADQIMSGVGLHGGKVSWGSDSRVVIAGIAVEMIEGTVTSARGISKMTLYIKRSDSLPYKAIVDLPQISDPDGNTLKITRTAVFSHQILNASIAKASFMFTPPAGSTKVASLQDLTSGLNSGGLE
jgi:outer membrane lipoprotein-sorting protein